MPIQERSMVHANNHYAHQSIFHNTYKHSLSHQSISHGRYKHSFSYHNRLHCTSKTFILHTIAYWIAHKTSIFHTNAYCIAHAKHPYCIPIYKTQASLEECHLCVRFHIVHSFNKYEARSAQHVSTANHFCCRHQQIVMF